jgi:hypothetical protein
MWLLLADLGPPHALVPTRARLSVERAPGAEQCPDGAALEQRAAEISGRPWHPADAAEAQAIDVRFERTADGVFVARFTATGPKPGQRLLRDASTSCDVLADAVSVAIALLLDGEPVPSTQGTEAAEKVPTRIVRQPADAGDPPARARASDLETRASLEAGGGYGLGGSGTFLGIGRVGVRHGHWLFDVAALASLARESSFEPGAVKTSLLFGSARACYLLGQRWTIAPCVQLGAGRLHGEGSGYGQTLSSSLPWLAGGLGLAGEAPLGSQLYATWGATLWVPTRRQTFSVENAGIAWESKPIAGLFSAGLGVTLF